MSVTWNSTWPLGTVSVKSNKITGNQNTTYIETIMGNDVVGTNAVTTRDHFWNVDANLDGHHRFIQSPAFTVASMPADPVISTNMDGVNYLKLINGQVQNFFCNVGGIYQTSPNILTGSFTFPALNISTQVVSIPANCYGEVFFYPSDTTQYSFYTTGTFISNGSITYWKVSSGGQGVIASASSSLYIMATSGSLYLGPWNYKITYRSL